MAYFSGIALDVLKIKAFTMEGLKLVVAEREGFEPSIRTSRIPDFESGAFDHSAISPHNGASDFIRCRIFLSIRIVNSGG